MRKVKTISGNDLTAFTTNVQEFLDLIAGNNIITIQSNAENDIAINRLNYYFLCVYDSNE